MKEDTNVNPCSHVFPYRWKLEYGFPAPGIKPNGLKVFGTFVCGGGSAMGYKLAGCDYLGGVEIDKRIGEVYCRNLHPKYFFGEDIRDFLKREDYPAELYNLDVLDGSPPCTLFSLNRGKKREESWGKKKTFKEGQEEQTIDDLCFVWTDLVKKLQPKSAIMENVEGLVKGGAKKYLVEIVKRLDAAGYASQTFVLDAQYMGVPQVRRRCFVIARRKDQGFNPLTLNFCEPVITFGDIREKDHFGKIEELSLAMWKQRKMGDKSIGDVCLRTRRKTSRFSVCFAYDHLPVPTLVTLTHVCFDHPRNMTNMEKLWAATFPEDYDYTGADVTFLTGMCVPPVMTAQIMHQIAKQWFNK